MQEQTTRFTSIELLRKGRDFKMKKNMALIFTTISVMSLIAVITGYVLDATGVYGAGFYLIGIGESTCITSAAVVVAIGIFDNIEK